MALIQNGGIVIGRIAGVPIRLQWTALLGAFVFTGFRFDPWAWACFFGLVIAHECGHALVVKAAGGEATLIELTGFGGLCHWRGAVSPIGRAAIAWGGIWAQFVLLAVAEAYLYAAGPPSSYAGWQVLGTLTVSNAWMIALNLIPIPPLDGAEAWRLPVLLGRALRKGPEAPPLPVMPRANDADEAFEAGARRDEVKAIVSSLLEEAKKDP